MQLKGILFDKDGTLINFEETFGPSTERVLRELSGGQEDKFLKMAEAWLFDPETLRFSPFSVAVGATTLEMAEAIAPFIAADDLQKLSIQLDRMYGDYCNQCVVSLPKTVPALEGLRKMGFKLGIATNDAEFNALSQMQQLGIDHMFDLIMGADSGHGGKPGGGMVANFARFVGCDPLHIAMVGDSVHDMESGKNAGSRTIGVETGPAARQELEGHCDMVLGSIAEIEQHAILAVD